MSTGHARTGRGRTVLFVCTGNSARSQLAEALLRELAGDRFVAGSAGTAPAGVNQFTIRVLEEVGISTDDLWSKSVTEALRAYGQPDLVVTVCDAAREACPVIPGASRTLHQSFADPAAVDGPEVLRLEAFRTARDEIRAWLRDGLLADG